MISVDCAELIFIIFREHWPKIVLRDMAISSCHSRLLYIYLLWSVPLKIFNVQLILVKDGIDNSRFLVDHGFYVAVSFYSSLLHELDGFFMLFLEYFLRCIVR